MISPCGRYRILPASVAAAHMVLANLSREEVAERDRLGINDYSSVLKQVTEDKAWAISTAPAAVGSYDLAIFGVTPDGYVWFLPTELCIVRHRRSMANRKTVKWVLEWIWSTVPSGADTRKPVLYNGVTPEGTGIQKWLTKVVGARFLKQPPVPCQTNGHPLMPFVLHYAPDYV